MAFIEPMHVLYLPPAMIYTVRRVLLITIMSVPGFRRFIDVPLVPRRSCGISYASAQPVLSATPRILLYGTDNRLTLCNDLTTRISRMKMVIMPGGRFALGACQVHQVSRMLYRKYYRMWRYICCPGAYRRLLPRSLCSQLSEFSRSRMSMHELCNSLDDSLDYRLYQLSTAQSTRMRDESMLLAFLRM